MHSLIRGSLLSVLTTLGGVGLLWESSLYNRAKPELSKASCNMCVAHQEVFQDFE